MKRTPFAERYRKKKIPQGHLAVSGEMALLDKPAFLLKLRLPHMLQIGIGAFHWSFHRTAPIFLDYSS